MYLSVRLQNMATFDLWQRVSLGKVIETSRYSSKKLHDIAADLCDTMYRFFMNLSIDQSDSYSVRNFVACLVKDLTVCLDKTFAGEGYGDFLIYYRKILSRYLMNNFNETSSLNIANYLCRDIKGVFETNNRLLQAFLDALNMHQVPSAFEFATIELASIFRFGPRAFLAHIKSVDPLTYLFSQASICSFRPEASKDALHQAVTDLPANVHLLWPALARHMARCSSVEDRMLLETLARDPEAHRAELGGELTDCLRYLVRGDVILEDDTEVTLNDLCDQAGVPHLPYLTDMPPELEIDWDGEEADEPEEPDA